ncbi:MAG: porin family protein [Desulfobacterales bacterium]|nr:porin family protein [Desulfobacterales bacterium]
MKQIIVILSFVLFCCTSFSQASEQDLYFGLNASLLNYKGAGSLDYSRHDMVMVKLGYTVNDYFSIESRVGFGFDDTETTYKSIEVVSLDSGGSISKRDLKAQLEMDNIFGIYSVWDFEITNATKSFFIAGLTRYEASLKEKEILGGESTPLGNSFGNPQPESRGEHIDNIDVSFGLGLCHQITENFRLDVEFMQYTSKANYKLSSFALGFSSFF